MTPSGVRRVSGFTVLRAAATPSPLTGRVLLANTCAAWAAPSDSWSRIVSLLLAYVSQAWW